ncbi:hypothetical protein D3875_13440 [Deinococcus cavernae]|uniref:Magnesium transporter CorA family protein n=1 Tax=Deinococcus cavernae TaxID=2320857 RepID=A0A418V8I8_9DEIO|nr:CorA family divalent cation transporter [Deinococcus cavernae]RJF72404.1 hypothetical protein D3875_13440 [Deinococcus cavernae]
MPTRVLLFNADGNDTELPFTAAALQKPGGRQLLWVDLEGEVPGNLADTLAALELDASSLGRLARPPAGHPYLTHSGAYLTLGVKAAQNARTFIPLTVVAGENFVVTAHPQGIGPLSTFMGEMQGDTQLGQLDSAAFVSVLLSRVLESYFTAMNGLEDQTDHLDERLLRPDPPEDPLEELVDLRRQAGDLRRELARHRPVFMHLAGADFVVYAGDQHEAQFGRLLTQFEHTLESALHTRDMVVESFDLYMARLGQRTNDIMRVLTIVTLTLGILAAVAGLMGMNFQADLFKTGNAGFRDVLIGSALLIVVILVLSRRRKWL